MTQQRHTSIQQPERGRLMITLLQLMTATHVALYRLTKGAIGGRIAGNPVLLLTTTGRKTGEPRTRPLLYLPTQNRMVVVGSAGSETRHPFWWLNLQANPRGQVQVQGRQFYVEATLASGHERDQLWQQLIQSFPRFAEMQQQTSRELPVIILTPAS